jgi:transposase
MDRVSISEEEGRQAVYAGTLVHPEVRTYMAAVAPALKEAGVSYKRQKNIARDAGYDVAESTFRRHRKRICAGEAPLSADKRSGRPRALSEQEVMVFVGWVLHQNDETKLSMLSLAWSF